MHKKNATKAKIKAGQPVIGFRLEVASPFLVEMLGGIGFDFVYFDCEHSSMTEEACENLCRAADAVDLTPLVRVPRGQPELISRFLDRGAMGVIVPHCGTRQAAQSAVEAAKYPPAGERGIDPVFLYKGQDIARHLKEANEETMVVGQIEEVEGVDNLSEVLAVEGLDVIFIGRHDLSVSMGLTGQIEHPRIAATVDKIIKEVRAAGKAVGVGAMPAMDPAVVHHYMRKGAQFFALGSTSLLRAAAIDLLRRIKTGQDKPGKEV